MDYFYAIALTPTVVGVALALVFWLFRSPGIVVPTGTIRTFATVGSGFALLILIGYSVSAVSSFWASPATTAATQFMQDIRFMFPLVLGIVLFVFLALPTHGERSQGSAELARRTSLSFARPWWLIVLGALILIALGLALAAGFASHPDSDGHDTLYSMDVGSVTVETTIYGWFYSAPCLILLAVIIVMTVVDLMLISRPSLGADRNRDTAVRRVRALNVLRGGIGAVLIHLSIVLQSLSATSTLNTQLTTGTIGQISVGSSFAALTNALQISSLVVAVLGVALWFSIVLSAIPSPLRTRRTASVS